MTKLLQKAFKKAAELPDVEQNALARRILSEMEAEKRWERTFAESEDVLDKLADEALEARRKGKTEPLDLSRL